MIAERIKTKQFVQRRKLKKLYRPDLVVMDADYLCENTD
jgi:hypothetical protein